MIYWSFGENENYQITRFYVYGLQFDLNDTIVWYYFS